MATDSDLLTRRQALRVALGGAATLTLGSILGACGGGQTAVSSPGQADGTSPAGSAPAAPNAAPESLGGSSPARSASAAPVVSSSAASTSMAASAASTASAVPAPASPASSAPASPAASAASGASAAAAACNGAVTPAETEGPFYKAGAPMKASLVEPGMTGTRLQLNGYVFNKSCQPVPQAKLDFWQADDSGRYDNQGYRLRGYVLADQAGRFEIETIIPGLYTGRTRHIHVKVTPPGGQTLTTQLYFPGEARNSSDGIFNQRLLVNIQDAPNGAKQATYSFVLNSA